MIYLANKNGMAVAYNDKEAMPGLYGVSAETEIADGEFYAAGGLARVIGGRIVVGKTEAEKLEERADGIKKQLAALDGEAAAGRAVREILLALAENAGTGGSAFDSLSAIEARAAELRLQLQAGTECRD